MEDLELGWLEEFSLSGLLDATDFTNCLACF
jgi:hypothetical protein